MVELDNPNITVKRQAELLSVNRTSVYRPSKEQRESEGNVQLMHRIDEIYMKHPYYGYRWTSVNRLDTWNRENYAT